MTTPFSIQPANAADFDAIQALVRTMDDLHHQNAPQRIKAPDDALIKAEAFLAQLEDPAQVVVVAMKDAAVIGYARAQIVSQPEGRAHRARRTAYIHEIVVDPAQRQKGAGKMLFDHIRQWAASNGVSSVELNVFEFNFPALNFYESLGFERLVTRFARGI